jgi:hypothetical protein
MDFFCQCNVVGMVCYVYTHQGRIQKKIIMSKMSINSVFRRLFAFLVAWLLVF